jgi:hypothetical protein
MLGLFRRVSMELERMGGEKIKSAMGSWISMTAAMLGLVRRVWCKESRGQGFSRLGFPGFKRVYRYGENSVVTSMLVITPRGERVRRVVMVTWVSMELERMGGNTMAGLGP